MVRKFRFGWHAGTSESSLQESTPPPYPEAIAQPTVITSEVKITTEVVTTTTTQTTTRFLSLPQWRKRASTMPPSGDFPFTSLSSTHPFPNDPQPSRLSRFDKSLPPTPSSELPSPQHQSTPESPADSADEIAEEAKLPSLFPRVSAPRSSDSVVLAPSSSTAALAHASLGLGLPHIIPFVSTGRHSSEINTVPFTNSPVSSHNLRKSKSSSRLDSLTPNYQESSSKISARRYSDAKDTPVSISSNLGVSTSNMRAKAKYSLPTTSSPAKALTRRASFWRRRKSLSQETPTVTAEDRFSSLPPLQFDEVLLATTSSELRSSHARGLSRSHSERAGPSKTDFVGPMEASSSRRLPNRPMTADAPHRVQNSAFDSNEQFCSSPITTPIQETVQHTYEARGQSRRPRAVTNPPLLHRLSLGLFSGSLGASDHHLPTTFRSSTASPVNPSPLNPDVNFASTARTEEHRHAVLPTKSHGESPELYLQRLISTVNKAEITAILASRLL
jgi:hypothetical protein